MTSKRLQDPDKIARAIFKAAHVNPANVYLDLAADIIAAALDECAAQERERCDLAALDLCWRADASDAMRVTATSIAAAIRDLT